MRLSSTKHERGSDDSGPALSPLHRRFGDRIDINRTSKLVTQTPSGIMTRAPSASKPNVSQPDASQPRVPGSDVKTSQSFWGPHAVEVNHTIRFELGPLKLDATRLKRELSLHWSRGVSPLVDRCAIERCAIEREATQFEGEFGSAVESDDAIRARYAFVESPSKLVLQPVLADRMMVARPKIPLTLLPGERVRLFISTPIWLRIVIDDNTREKGERILWEEPVSRPADTWFGDKTTVGEMAYASRTNAHLSLDDVAWLPQRAVTEVDVSNEADEELVLSRLSIPVRHLSVHQNERGQLWTPSVRLSRMQAETSADVEVRRVPKLAGQTELVGEARDPYARTNAIRAFAKLFAE